MGHEFNLVLHILAEVIGHELLLGGLSDLVEIFCGFSLEADVAYELPLSVVGGGRLGVVVVVRSCCRVRIVSAVVRCLIHLLVSMSVCQSINLAIIKP